MYVTFEAGGGGLETEPACRINHHRRSIYGRVDDASDVGASLYALGADSYGLCFARNTGVADLDVAVPGGKILACSIADSDVGASASVVVERGKPKGCVAKANLIRWCLSIGGKVVSLSHR